MTLNRWRKTCVYFFYKFYVSYSILLWYLWTNHWCSRHTYIFMHLCSILHFYCFVVFKVLLYKNWKCQIIYDASIIAARLHKKMNLNYSTISHYITQHNLKINITRKRNVVETSQRKEKMLMHMSAISQIMAVSENEG